MVQYKNNETEEYLHEQVGKCDRENNCGYHYGPKDYFRDNPSFDQFKNSLLPMYQNRQIKKTPISYTDPGIVKYTFDNYEYNNFYKYLLLLFGEQITKKLFNRFRIGTSSHIYLWNEEHRPYLRISEKWLNATVFWQVDQHLKIRGGKVMVYNAVTGKRLKEKGRPFINWMHEKGKYNLAQCLFGIHQIRNAPKTQEIAIVESEKTAVIMSALYPEYIWMATGALNGINHKKFEPLMGYPIVLYPDLGKPDKRGRTPYQLWEMKGYDLDLIGHNCSLSYILEEVKTPERIEQGWDLLDLCLYQDNEGTAINEDGELIILQSNF